MCHGFENLYFCRSLISIFFLRLSIAISYLFIHLFFVFFLLALTRRSYIERLRPSQAVLAIIIHRIHTLLLPVFAETKRYQRLVRREQRTGERIPPVDAQARARHLDPALDLAHHGQLAREDFAQQQVDPGDAPLAQPPLNQGHRVRVALAAERAEDEAPAARLAGRLDGRPADRLHLFVTVRLACELARVRVVAVRRYRGVVDHDALQVETPVAEVQNQVDAVLVVEPRRGAAQDLTFAERRNLWDEHVEPGRLEGAAYAVDGGVELDGSDEGDGLAAGEVSFKRGEEVRRVNANVHEHVKRLDLGHIDGDQAAVGVVHEQVTAEGTGRVVVDAAGAIGDVAHDEGLNARTELGEDVGDCGCEEKQALGHLQGYFFRPGGLDTVYRLGNLKAVVGGEQGDGLLELGVLGYFRRDTVEQSWCPPWLGSCVKFVVSIYDSESPAALLYDARSYPG